MKNVTVGSLLVVTAIVAGSLFSVKGMISGQNPAASNPKASEPVSSEPVDEFDGKEPDAILLLTDEEPVWAPVPDTSNYVFGYDKSTHGFFGGGQLFGTMDKIGVHRNVHDQYPDLSDDLSVMAAAKADRVQFLSTQGVTLPPDLFWKIEVDQLAMVGSQERYLLTAAVGNDTITPPGSRPYPTVSLIHELWEKRPDEEPLLLRRSLSFAEIDTVVPN